MLMHRQEWTRARMLLIRVQIQRQQRELHSYSFDAPGEYAMHCEERARSGAIAA
jgi:hypothetical protein